MRYLIIFLITFIIGVNNTYGCEKSSYILEFYESEYVFEGVINSEMVTKDEKNYIVIFDIDKHYKSGNNPKKLEFNLELENTFKESGSCVDRPIRLGQKWLVYAYIDTNEKLKFNFYCSNTKQIKNEKSISDDELKVLKNGNNFVIDDYIYEFQDNFSSVDHLSKIENVLNNSKLNNLNKGITTLILKINKDGILESVSNEGNYTIEVDKNFNLIKNFRITNKNDFTEFDKLIIDLVKKVKNWGIKYHKKTKLPVDFIITVTFEYNKKTNKISCDYK